MTLHTHTQTHTHTLQQLQQWQLFHDLTYTHTNTHIQTHTHTLQQLLQWQLFHDLTHAPRVATLHSSSSGSLITVLDAHTGRALEEIKLPGPVDKVRLCAFVCVYVCVCVCAIRLCLLCVLDAHTGAAQEDIKLLVVSIACA